MAASAGTAEHVTTVPLGGSLDGQSGDHYYGVYVPTRFGGELPGQDDRRAIVDLKRTQRRASDQRPGHRLRPAGVVHLQGRRCQEALHGRNEFVQVGQSTKKPWNFYYWPTKADSIHEPWAGGNARVDTMTTNGDDQLIATPGGYIAPGQDIVLAGPNGLLETLPAAGDDATWFPNLYDDLTWVGPDKQNGGQITRFHDPVAPAEVRPALWHLGAAVGGGVQSEQRYLALARPLPGRRGGLDPAERACARALDRDDQ